MLLMVFILLATSDVSSLRNNLSPLRLGRAKLLEDLRAHSAFRNKLSPCSDDNNVDIIFRYRHYEVLTVDETEQAVSSVGYVSVTWKDEDLTWNASDYGGVDIIRVHYDELWHPTIILTNAVEPDYLLVDRIQTLTLTSRGYVSYVSPVYPKTTCDMDLKYFPFDSQKCEIVFMPFIDDIRYNITAATTGGLDDHFTITGQWVMASKSIRTDILNVIDGLQVVTFTMEIKRRAMYYVICILSPMLLTSSVTSMVFWIPPSSGEKISFLVTVFVSNAVFINFIAGSLPRNMSNIPRVAVFLVMVNFQCMFAMIATIFVLRRYEQEQKEAVTRERDAMFEQTDKNDLGQKNKVIADAESKMDPTSATNWTGGFTTHLFKKLAFLKPRIAPFDTSNTKTRRTAQRKPRECCLGSSTWDMIFFWTFHLTSGPCYYMVFAL